MIETSEPGDVEELPCEANGGSGDLVGWETCARPGGMGQRSRYLGGVGDSCVDLVE